MKYRMIATIGLLLFAPAALADVEYYTYGGFISIVNAFTRLAVIFNSDNFLYFSFTASLVGVMAGMAIKVGLASFGKSKGSDALAILALTMFGTAFFIALFGPKTTVHIYDPTVNKYETVGDVPNALAFITSASNMLERYATDIFSVASPFGRDRHANGKSLELILNLINSDPLASNIGATKSIDSYFKKCVQPAVVNGVDYDDFDYNSILSGTNDFWDELEKTQNPDQYFTWFDDSDQRGVAMNCSDGFTQLSTLLQNPDTFRPHLEYVCNMSGFDSSIAAEYVECQSLIEDAIPFIYAANVDVSATNLSAMAALADSLYMTLSKNPGSAVASIGNAKQMSQGYGSVIVSEGWLPVMRSATLVLILSFTPIIVLLIVTPFVFRALHMLSALFIFIMIWGACDAIVHSVITDTIQSMFLELRSHGGGLKAFMLAPSQLQKAIAMFGKLQSMGVIFAGLITAWYFKFSGHQFANMGEKLTADIDNTGQQTGMEAIDPVGRSHSQSEYAGASGHYNAQKIIGVDNLGAGLASHRNYHAMNEGQKMHLGSEDGMSKLDVMSESSQVQGGTDYGHMKETNSLAKSQNAESRHVASELAQTNTRMNNATTSLHGDQMERYDGSKHEQADDYVTTVNSETLGKVNGSGANSKEMVQSDTTQVEQRLGATDAIEKRAAANSQSVKGYSEDQTATSNITTEAERNARENAVNEGHAGSSLGVANVAAENAVRRNIAEERAREQTAIVNDKSEQQVVDNAALYGQETTAGQVKTRQALANAIRSDTQDIADREAGTGVRMVASPEEVANIQSSSKSPPTNTLPAQISDSIFTAGIVPNNDGEIETLANQSTSNVSTESYGSQSRNHFGVRNDGQLASGIQNDSTEEVIRYIEQVYEPSARWSAAQNLAGTSGISRQMSESERNSVSFAGVGTLSGSIGKKLDPEGIIDTVTGSGSTDSPSKSSGNVNEMLGMNKKAEIDSRKNSSTGGLLDKVAGGAKGAAKSLAPDAEASLRLSGDARIASDDQTLETATADTTAGEYYKVLSEAVLQKQAGELSDYEIAQSLQARIYELQERDKDQLNRIVNESDPSLIEDAIPITSDLADYASGLVEDAGTTVSNWWDEFTGFDSVER